MAQPPLRTHLSKSEQLTPSAGPLRLGLAHWDSPAATPGPRLVTLSSQVRDGGPSPISGSALTTILGSWACRVSAPVTPPDWVSPANQTENTVLGYCRTFSFYIFCFLQLTMPLRIVFPLSASPHCDLTMSLPDVPIPGSSIFAHPLPNQPLQSSPCTAHVMSSMIPL